MHNVTRTYLIQAPLDIAYGWVNRAVPKTIRVGDTSITLHRKSKLDRDHALAEVKVWAERISTRISIWHVTAFPGRSVWFARSAEAQVGSDGTIAAAATRPSREPCVEGIVARRLPRLEQVIRELGGMLLPHFSCTLDALSATETLANAWTTPAFAQVLRILDQRLAQRARLLRWATEERGDATDEWLRDWLKQAPLNSELLELLRDGETYERIGEWLGISADTVARAAKRLAERGYIPRRRRGRPRG